MSDERKKSYPIRMAVLMLLGAFVVPFAMYMFGTVGGGDEQSFAWPLIYAVAGAVGGLVVELFFRFLELH